MNVRYRVELTQYERNELLALLSGGKHPARKLKRAEILLAAELLARSHGRSRHCQMRTEAVAKDVNARLQVRAACSLRQHHLHHFLREGLLS